MLGFTNVGKSPPVNPAFPSEMRPGAIGSGGAILAEHREHFEVVVAPPIVVVRPPEIIARWFAFETARCKILVIGLRRMAVLGSHFFEMTKADELFVLLVP